MSEDHKSERFFPFLSFILITCLFAYLLYASWYRWGSLLIDTFRDIWVCSEMLKGKTLYKDIFFEYGPFVPYLMTTVCAYTGVKLSVFVALGIFSAAAMSLLIYLIARYFTGMLPSVIAVVMFLLVFAFSCFNQYHAIFNFILPYSYSMTSCVIFISLSLYYYLLLLRDNRWWASMCFMVSLFMAFTCRLEIPVLAWIVYFATTVITILAIRKSIGWNDVIKIFLSISVPVLLAAVFYMGIYPKDELKAFYECNVKMMLVNIGPYFKQNLAVDSKENVVLVCLMLKSFGMQVLVYFGLLLAAILIKKGKQSKAGIIWVFLSMMLIGLAIKEAEIISISQNIQYRSLPVLIFIMAVICFCRMFTGMDPKKEAGFIALAGIATVLLSRIIIAITPVYYSFCLAVMGVVCYVVFFFEIIPSFVSDKTKQIHGTTLRVLFSIFLVVSSIHYWVASERSFLSRTRKVDVGIGRLYAKNDNQTEVICMVAEYLKANTAPDATIAAMPECVSMFFMAKRRHLTEFATFHPQAFMILGEDRIIDSFKKSDPDYVVLVARTTFEHGYPFFGTDYARRMYQYVLANYDAVYQVGPYPFTSLDIFGAVVFKKKSLN